MNEDKTGVDSILEETGSSQAMFINEILVGEKVFTSVMDSDEYKEAELMQAIRDSKKDKLFLRGKRYPDQADIMVDVRTMDIGAVVMRNGNGKQCMDSIGMTTDGAGVKTLHLLDGNALCKVPYVIAILRGEEDQAFHNCITTLLRISTMLDDIKQFNQAQE